MRTTDSRPPTPTDVGAVPAYLQIAILMASAVAAALFSLPALAPLLGPVLGVGKTQLGLLTSALMAAHAVSQVGSGWFIGRLGLRRAAIVLGLGMALLTVLVSLVTDIWVMVLLRFLLGLATGAAFVVGSAYVAACAPPSRARTDQGLFGAFTGFGAAIAFILLPVSIVWLGWRGNVVTTLFFAVAATLLAWRYPLPRDQHVARPIAPGALLRLFGQPTVLLLGIIHLGSFGSFVALTAWLTTLLVGSTGSTLNTSLLLSAGLLTFSGIARWLGGPAIRWWSERQVIVGSMIGAVLSLGGLGVVSSLDGGGSLAPRLALALVAIWCCSFTFASVFQLGFLLSQPGQGASSVGLISAIAVAGSAVLPSLFGLAVDLSGGFALGFAVLAAAPLASALAGWVITRDPRVVARR